MHDGAFTTLEETVRHHLDPYASLIGYDASEVREPFRSTLDTDPDRNAARAAAIDPVLANGIDLTAQEFEDLIAFLHALTDPSSVNLLDDIPDRVPSGLPVAD